MLISQLVEELKRVKEKCGDIEVTCTGSLLGDNRLCSGDVFETTVENLVVKNVEDKFGHRVRLYM